jgi:hypothetical protein
VVVATELCARVAAARLQRVLHARAHAIGPPVQRGPAAGRKRRLFGHFVVHHLHARQVRGGRGARQFVRLRLDLRELAGEPLVAAPCQCVQPPRPARVRPRRLIVLVGTRTPAAEAPPQPLEPASLSATARQVDCVRAATRGGSPAEAGSDGAGGIRRSAPVAAADAAEAHAVTRRRRAGGSVRVPAFRSAVPARGCAGRSSSASWAPRSLDGIRPPCKEGRRPPAGAAGGCAPSPRLQSHRPVTPYGADRQSFRALAGARAHFPGSVAAGFCLRAVITRRFASPARSRRASASVLVSRRASAGRSTEASVVEVIDGVTARHPSKLFMPRGRHGCGRRTTPRASR